MKFKAVGALLKRIKAIKQFLKDPSVSKLKKLLIIFGIIYLVSPVDLIPAPVLGLNIIDDAVLWTAILTYLSSELDKYVIYSQSIADSLREKKRFKGKDIIESVGEEVEENKADGAESQQ